MNIIFLFLVFLFSCVSPPMQEEGFNVEEEEAFLEEDEIDEELESGLEDNAIDLQAQDEEKEAEGELEEIEDEFAEFIDEEDDEVVTEESDQEDVEVAKQPVVEKEEVAQTDAEATDEQPVEEVVESAEEEIAQTDAEATDEQPVEEVVESAEEEIAQTDAEATDEQPVEGVVESAEEEVAQTGAEATDEQSIVESTEDVEVAETQTGQITNIRYESNNIYIDTVGDLLSYRSRFNEATRQLIIEIPGATIVDQLKWPYIMKEFDSHYALLQADQKTKDTVRVIIQMRPSVEKPSILQKDSGDGFIISSSVHDLTESEIAEADIKEGEEFSDDVDVVEVVEEEEILGAKTIDEFLLGDHKFYGQPITLDVKDANLKDILYFLAEDTGINMIISNGIPAGDKISIFLREVPWDQALVLIMKHKKLGYIRRGNVIIISTLNEIQEERKLLEQMIANRQRYAQLNLEIIPIDYAKANQISRQLEIFRTKNNANAFINVDSNNNFLIIRDTEEAITKMKELIKKLDRVPKQVVIAAKIVEVNDSFNREFGISWNLSGHPFSIPIGRNSIDINPSPFFSALPGAPNSGTIGSNLRIGTFKYIGDLDAFFGLAENEDEVRVLSSPRIVALNGQSATVNQNSESISFSAVTPVGGGTQTQVQRSPLTLSLSVTPNITNVNSVYLKVNMTRSFEGGRITSEGGSSAAPTFTRSANTEILVNNGQTAVIGGVYETSDTQSILGLPILKYIPFVNWLFSKKSAQTVKRELLLFLTPQIVPWDKSTEESTVRTNRTDFSSS